MGGVLRIQIVAGRNFQRFRTREIYALTGHDKAVAANVLDAYRSADTYFGVRIFGSVGSLRAGGGIRGQLDLGALYLALLSHQDDGVVLQVVDANRTGQCKGTGRLFL